MKQLVVSCSSVIGNKSLLYLISPVIRQGSSSEEKEWYTVARFLGPTLL